MRDRSWAYLTGNGPLVSPSLATQNLGHVAPSVDSLLDIDMAEAPLIQQYRCGLPSCTKITLTAKSDMVAHQEKHLTELATQWKMGSGCPWPSCRSQKLGKIFGSRRLYKKHLHTHLKRHWCQHHGCTYGKPFGTSYDLDRHIRSVHLNARGFPCPLCTQNFPRKDKLLDHSRKDHGTLKCNFDHCEKIVDAVEADTHFQAFHDSKLIFECALSGCESTKSLFSEFTARDHLGVHHGMGYPYSYSVMSSLAPKGRTRSKPMTMSPNTIDWAWFVSNLRPCSLCAKKRASAEGTQQNGDD